MASFTRIFFAPISIILAWLTIGASLLAYSAAYISPNWVSWLPFFGVFYPFWLVCQIVLLPFVFSYKKKLFVYLLLTSLLGYNHFANNIQLTRHADKRLTDKSFSLVSYNIGGNSISKKLKYKEVFAKKAAILNSIRPDILCLQESHPSMMRFEGDSAQILPQYPYSVADRLYGVSIYSDFPIRRHRFFALPTQPLNVAMYADINLNSRTVRIFNLHLQSNRLGDDADHFVQNLDNIDEKESKETYMRTFRKLRSAWQKRAEQAAVIVDSIAASPYPVIICGDFNDTPSSYVYTKLSSNLRDAFRIGGRGTSFSYNGKLPGVSIDHILVAKNYPIYGFRVVRKVAGDHYPIRAEIGY